MKNAVIYVHGKGGAADEAEHYKPLFFGSEVIGLDYKSQTPWDCVPEFHRFFKEIKAEYSSVTLIANSIGAFFSMCALDTKTVDNALFISPIVDMEKLISDMMSWAGVTENELRTRKEIPTGFGETLSWQYLCYVREHSIDWSVPTRILYGEHDNLTKYKTVSDFALKIGAPLTVMQNGEHWFHTAEQMQFLDNWVKNTIVY